MMIGAQGRRVKESVPSQVYQDSVVWNRNCFVESVVVVVAVVVGCGVGDVDDGDGRMDWSDGAVAVVGDGVDDDEDEHLRDFG
ncbi:hypothetical protein M0802_001225 [Mischocyttarus mexicanus]|nr:hypothetical protein M0802_001225 [Mischocyttarus mexicanus]